MSATPNRPGDDSAFGKPDVSVTYRRAVLEGSVKPMQCHAYTYRIDAIENGGRHQLHHARSDRSGRERKTRGS